MKTAVEWLADEIIMLEERLRQEEINLNDFMDLKDDLVTRALEIEKEQILDSYKTGIWDVGCRSTSFEEYYNRTFKQQEQ
jgi:hypothetical protein